MVWVGAGSEGGEEAGGSQELWAGRSLQQGAPVGAAAVDANPEVVVTNGDGDGEGDKEAANPMNVDLIPPQLPSQAGKVVVDPVTEVVPDMEVKIADLGNACWVVSGRFSFFKLEEEASGHIMIIPTNTLM